MSAGMLFSQMHPPSGEEAEFHDWYNTEHIPDRMVLPGFSHAIRYATDAGEPRYLAVYYLDDMSVLDTPEYRTLKEQPSTRTAHMLSSVSGFTRYIADLISDTGEVPMRDAGALSVVAFAVPEADEAQFEDWYQGEHVDLLMQVPGWLRIRRYRVRPGFAGTPFTHFALHELSDASVMDAPERERARTTAKRDALAEREWFGQSGRWLYTPIHYAESSAD